MLLKINSVEQFVMPAYSAKCESPIGRNDLVTDVSAIDARLPIVLCTQLCVSRLRWFTVKALKADFLRSNQLRFPYDVG